MITDIFRAALDENLGASGGAFNYLKQKGMTVRFAANHYFDGYKADPDYAMRNLAAPRTPVPSVPAVVVPVASSPPPGSRSVSVTRRRPQPPREWTCQPAEHGYAEGTGALPPAIRGVKLTDYTKASVLITDIVSVLKERAS